jgi:malate permease and related proteins
MQTQIILTQITIAAIMAIIGAIAAHFKIISDAVRDAIAKLVFYITLPLLILTTFSNIKLTHEIIVNGAYILLFSFIAFIILFSLGLFSTKIFVLPERKRAIHITHTMFGNIVYLGFPVIYALFPNKESLLYAALYYFVSTIIMWTAGVVILTGSNNLSLKERIKNLINPNIIAFITGVTMMSFGIGFPSSVFDSLSQIGNTTTVLSMLYIGALLAQTNIKGLLKRFDVYMLSLNKLIIAPLILLFIIKTSITFFNINMSPMALNILILQTAMPCMTMVVILAKQFGADDTCAAENVFVSTLLSVITLPLIYFILQL